MLKSVREYHYVMTEQAKLREYGCAEITYTDHFYASESHAKIFEEIGTEDFDAEQWKKIHSRIVVRPTGKTDKNGEPIMEYVGTVRARTTQQCALIAKLVMAGKDYTLRCKKH